MRAFVKKNKSLFLIALCIVAGIFIPWLSLIFGAYILTPTPPKPEITYSEFPLQLIYEFDGEIFEINDTYVCEFDGFDFTTATGEKYRKWQGYFKSGNNRITLGEKEGLEFYCFSVSEHWDSMAGRYMGDPDYNGRIYEKPPSIFYTDNFDKKEIDEILKEDEAWGKYNIRIINWEISPPIENIFK